LIEPDEIETAWHRLHEGDVQYRFVIDLASLAESWHDCSARALVRASQCSLSSNCTENLPSTWTQRLISLLFQGLPLWTR